MADGSFEPFLVQSRNNAELDDAVGWLRGAGGAGAGSSATDAQPGKEGDASKREDGETQPFRTSDPNHPSGTVATIGAPSGDGVMAAVGKFVTDLPLQTIGGMRDALQEVNDVIRVGSDAIEGVAPLGFARDEKEELEFVHPFMDRDRLEQLRAIPSNREVKLPEVAHAKTAGGEMFRKMVQFGVGFKGVGMAMKGVGIAEPAGKAAALAFDVGRGMLTDMLIWDEHESRLSDLIESVPALQNPITEYLKTDQDDGMFEGKLKQALEGAGISLAVKGATEAVKLVAKGVKTIKAGRAAQVDLEAAAVRAADPVAEAAAQAKRDIMVLGDPSAPVTKTVKVDSATGVVLDQLEKGPAGAAGVAGLDSATAKTMANAADSIAAREAAGEVIEKVVPNFARINGDEDIEAALTLMSEAAKPTKVRVSQAMTHEAAKATGIEELLSMDIKAQGINAAKLDALKDFYAASATMLKQTAEVAYAAPTDGNLFAFRKAMAIHQALLDKFSAARSEAGRTLNILKRFSDSGDTERLGQMQDFLTGLGGRDVAMALVEKVRMVKDGSADALNGIVKRGAGARTLDAVTEAWTLGLVSGVRSQGRNIVSNAAYALVQIPERAIAARLPGATVEKGEALAMMAGYGHSLKQAFINAGKSFWNGTTDIGVGAVELPHRKALGGDLFNLPDGNARRVADAFGEIYRVWGRTLTAGDAFFQTINYQGELYAQAWRLAKTTKEGTEATFEELGARIANPTEGMRVAAMEAARRGTFTQTPGAIAQSIQSMKYDDNMALAITARFIFPFVRTPANITRTGMSYTPAAVLMPRTFWAEIQKGGAAKDVALTKLAVGSAGMAFMSDLVMRGEVTGNGPSNAEDRAAWRAAGYEPYSIRLGGTWYNYRTFEPLGMPLGMAADVTEKLMEYYKLADSDDPAADERMDKLAVASAAALGNAFMSQTFSRGFTTLAAALDNPDMKAENYVEGVAKSVVPRALASFYEMADVTGNDTLKDVNGAWDAIDAELRPWAANPSRDVFGQPRYRQDTFVPLQKTVGQDTPLVSPMMRIIEAVSPIYTGERVGTPIAMEIFRQGIKVARPGKAQSFTDPDSGQRVTMDLKNYPAVWDRFQVLAGHEQKIDAFGGVGLQDYLNALVEGRDDMSEYYRALPDGDEPGIEGKGHFIKGKFAVARDEARRAIMADPQFADFQAEVARRGRRQAAINLGNER